VSNNSLVSSKENIKYIFGGQGGEGSVPLNLDFTHFLAELGTRYFFPGSLIANSLFLDHGSLSLNR